MNFDHVAVATITWARDASEVQLLTTALDSLARMGLPVTVSDRSASPDLDEALRRLGFVTAPPRAPGLVEQVKAAFDAALQTERPFILYTEPDKEDFFQQRLRRFLGNAPDAEDVGVVLASRSDASFATFLPLQQFTEATINRLCGDLTGHTGDFSYGPFIMRRELLHHLRKAPATIGWGWRHFVFGIAHRCGYRLIHLVDDHPCPLDQRGEDESERIHRLRQLSQNIEGLVLSMTAHLDRGEGA